MKDNSGLSLVELTIVVAIMAILIGLVSMGVSVIWGMDAKKAAGKIDSYLKETKTAALGRDFQELKIYADGTGDYYADFVIYEYQQDPANPGVVLPNPVPVVSKTEYIGKKTVTITCRLQDGSVLTISPGGNTLTLGYNRASGAFTYAKVDDIVSATYCTEINLVQGSKTYSLELIPSTGKHRYK